MGLSRLTSANIDFFVSSGFVSGLSFLFVLLLLFSTLSSVYLEPEPPLDFFAVLILADSLGSEASKLSTAAYLASNTYFVSGSSPLNTLLDCHFPLSILYSALAPFSLSFIFLSVILVFVLLSSLGADGGV